MAIIALSAFTSMHVDQYKVDTESSVITWKAGKINGSTHEGTIQLSEGIIRIDHGKVAGGNFTADMESIKVTDIEGKYAEKLEGHLASEDFFNVAEFKQSKFTIGSVSKNEDGTFKVLGIMTIKGIKKPLRFNAQLSFTDNSVSMSGTALVNRTEYDIKYGSAQFFSDLGDRAIKDEFELNFNIVANK